MNGVEMEYYYKDLQTGKFNLLKKMKWYDTFTVLSFNYASKDPDDAYVMTNLDSDKTEIVLYDLKQNKSIRKLFSNPDYDVAGMRLSRKRNYEIDYFAYEGERYVILPQSNFFRDFSKKMAAEFKDVEYYVTDFDDNETRFLIVVRATRCMGNIMSTIPGRAGSACSTI